MKEFLAIETDVCYFCDNKLYTVSKVDNNYRIVEVMYGQENDMLYFEQKTKKVGEVHELDVKHNPYIDFEKFMEEIICRTGR